MYNYETVQSAFVDNDLESIRKVNEYMLKQIGASNTKSMEELLDAIYDTKSSLARNFGAEIFIPAFARQQQKKCTAIR